MSRQADHMANERTFLAYVRTSIALVTFGIAINRFSQFLIQERKVLPEFRYHLFLEDTSRVGLSMAVFGLIVLIWSAARATRVNKAIDRGTYTPDYISIWLVTVGVLACGALGVLWMFRN